jgi:hypothetical protein
VLERQLDGLVKRDPRGSLRHAVADSQ